MAFVAPVFSPCPTVVTVFDLSFLLYPAAFKATNRCYLRLMTRISTRRAGHVIAISECTRQAVIAKLGIPADRVQTIYCGVDPSFRPLSSAEAKAFRQQKGLPERFILFLGTIEPRKNVSRLVEAFAMLRVAYTQAASPPHLVIAGGRGWLSDPVFARIEELGVQDRVHVVGYVPEEEKRLWYGASTCFCYPSLYEGFGLPPLEAMACGIPVIASNVSSLPEVVGEAGLTVPPQDSRALSKALSRALEDAGLRAELSQKGLARAQQFSWAESARQTAAVYRTALARRADTERE
jgi:glycosyltransferase involved in cell wall biosynthesis